MRHSPKLMAARARFMRGVSHDLKNPIHAIDGHAQLLEDGVRGPLNAEQRDSVERIRRSAQALMGLIEDLLELARAEAGQLTVKLDRVVLRDVVHEVVEEHRAAAQFAGLTLVNAEDDSQTILTTDPARVTQVLGNLLSNAIKYTPAGGRIEVSTELPRGAGPKRRWSARDPRRGRRAGHSQRQARGDFRRVHPTRRRRHARALGSGSRSRGASRACSVAT